MLTSRWRCRCSICCSTSPGQSEGRREMLKDFLMRMGKTFLGLSRWTCSSSAALRFWSDRPTDRTTTVAINPRDLGCDDDDDDEDGAKHQHNKQHINREWLFCITWDSRRVCNIWFYQFDTFKFSFPYKFRGFFLKEILLVGLTGLGVLVNN